MCAGDVSGEGQVRRQMERRSVRWEITLRVVRLYRHGLRSCQGERLLTRGRKRRKVEQRRLRRLRERALEPYLGGAGGFELRSKVRLPSDRAKFAEIAEGNSDFTRRMLRTFRRGLGDARAHSRLPRVQSSEQRHESHEPFRGMQKKVYRSIGEVGDERMTRET